MVKCVYCCVRDSEGFSQFQSHIIVISSVTMAICLTATNYPYCTCSCYPYHACTYAMSIQFLQKASNTQKC